MTNRIKIFFIISLAIIIATGTLFFRDFLKRNHTSAMTVSVSALDLSVNSYVCDLDSYRFKDGVFNDSTIDILRDVKQYAEGEGWDTTGTAYDLKKYTDIAGNLRTGYDIISKLVDKYFKVTTTKNSSGSITFVTPTAIRILSELDSKLKSMESGVSLASDHISQLEAEINTGYATDESLCEEILRNFSQAFLDKMSVESKFRELFSVYIIPARLKQDGF